MMTTQEAPALIDLAERLGQRFAEAAAQARREGRAVLASLAIPPPAPLDPVAFFARGAGLWGERAYWERPAAGIALVGLGAVRTIRTEGLGRFPEAAGAIRRDLAGAIIDEQAEPVYLGGFAFAPDAASGTEGTGFPAGLLILPRLLLAVRGGEATLTLNALVGPDAGDAGEAEAAARDIAALDLSDLPLVTEEATAVAREFTRQEAPAAGQWKGAVTATAADVRAGHFEKVVLARTLRLRPADGAPFDMATALARLRTAYPSAHIFAVAGRGRCFLGATPELLVRLRGRDVEAMCLAGTTARGASAQEDAALAGALLESAKNRIEHAVVVRSVQEALTPVCDDVISDAAPRIMRVANVQHLYTPVRGRLAGERGVLDLVERLHPTPAVGGFPRRAALAAIREREGFDRGWYAGPVGWIGREGGEFAVAIRSAAIVDRPDGGQEATLYAGCGIVADSRAEAEWAESELKLRPMLAALGVRHE